MIEANPMMPLEQQVCSRELAQRLAELGVRQESMFWWVDKKVTYTGGLASQAQRKGGVSALTVAELGELLPDDITIPSKHGKPRAHTHWLRFGRYRVAGQRFWCAYPGGRVSVACGLFHRASAPEDASATTLQHLPNARDVSAIVGCLRAHTVGSVGRDSDRQHAPHACRSPGLQSGKHALVPLLFFVLMSHDERSPGWSLVLRVCSLVALSFPGGWGCTLRSRGTR